MGQNTRTKLAFSWWNGCHNSRSQNLFASSRRNKIPNRALSAKLLKSSALCLCGLDAARPFRIQMTKTATICDLYTRGSSRNQAGADYSSLETQRERLEAYCKSQDDYTAYRVYEDGGIFRRLYGPSCTQGNAP